jgi:Leucine-rich repeat (LRR) protein
MKAVGLVDAPSGSRAVCRECGSAIEAGEPRFGRDEGSAGARRLRWRHLACAAAALPEALLRALELGGWRSVPDDEHEELRTLIASAVATRRSPLLTPRADPNQRERERESEPKAARSSSAMAAAAVLEPAHEAATLPPAQARAWVFADALQARGDVRGELLALELAAEHTEDPVQARALQREHRACWRAFDPSPKPGAALRLRWVGGFLLGGYPKEQRELHRLLASPAASSLSRIRLDFCTHEELARLVAVAKAHARRLRVVDLPNSRSSDLRALAGLVGLECLRVGERFDPALLAELPGLVELGLTATESLDVAELAPVAKQLERLELRNIVSLELDGLGQRLPALVDLTLAGMRFDGDPKLLHGATALRSLRLPDSPLRSLGPIPSLPGLRELAIVPAKLHVIAELAALTKLERLVIGGSKVAELDSLSGMQACEHLALSETRITRLEPLAGLPRLRSLWIEGGDLRRISGLGGLTELEQLTLAKVANLDVSSLAGFARLHTLVLDPGGRRPRSLDSLAQLPKLRRLSAPVELLDDFGTPHQSLAALEVLELTGARPPELRRVAKLPHLRRLLLPGRDPAAIEALADALPDVAIFGDVAARDRLDHRDPFDWRSVDWPQG